MKQSQVKPGVRAMLSLGARKGSVAVTVIRRALLSDMRRCLWVTEDSLCRLRTVTARQLQPLPVTDASGKLIGYAKPRQTACDCRLVMRRALWCEDCVASALEA